MKRFVCFFLTMILLLGLVPVSAEGTFYEDPIITSDSIEMASSTDKATLKISLKNSSNAKLSGTLHLYYASGAYSEYNISSNGLTITGFTVGNTYGLSIYVTNYGTHTVEFTPTSAITYTRSYTLYPYSYYPDFEEPINSFTDPDPSVNQHFGWRARSGRDYHTGVDIAMDANGNSYEYMNPRPNVYSVCDGTINQVLYDDDSLGNTVQVLYSDGSHNYYVTYAHLNSISCGNSGSISEGTKIGVVGKSGDVTGAHLHISTSTSSYFTKTPGSWIDPAAFGIY